MLPRHSMCSFRWTGRIETVLEYECVLVWFMMICIESSLAHVFLLLFCFCFTFFAPFFPLSLSLSCCLSVSSDARGRVPASGPVWIRCWFWDGRWPAFPGVPSHHLPWNQSQEPIFRPLPALSHEWAVWDCRYTRGHRGDHWWGICYCHFTEPFLSFSLIF